MCPVQQSGLSGYRKGYPGTVRRKPKVDTEAVAIEIVALKNRLAELDGRGEGDSDEWDRLHQRLGNLQEQLAGAPANGGDATARQNQGHYVPPA